MANGAAENKTGGAVRAALSGTVCLFALVGAGSLGLYKLSPVLEEETLVAALKTTSVIAGVVWGFSVIVFNKLSDLTEIPGIDYKQHRNLEMRIHQELRLFWVRSVLLAGAAFAMNLPSFEFAGTKAVSQWNFSLAGGALGFAVFLLRSVVGHLEDVRVFRSAVKEAQRIDEEAERQLRDLKLEKPWERDPRLATFGPTADDATPTGH